ncbi:SprT family protein [Salicibibacter halophilus]|uniref:Protein SprT-like n=1 Tax=Salicibibacter halophilus TaxID=2502791 RepID=A0A514LKT9_9BACI|nr:SprT family protein [Salicibibacter halophilus]QDI92480.1 SprT family protein [Salicibibacter halophilus]
MNDEQLQRFTEALSIRYFQKPFRHQIRFNSRLRTTGGRYMLRSHAIEINPKHEEHFGQEELEAIIKHELCHYHLHIEGKGYQHKDKDFKRLLQKVGGSRHCQTIPGMRKTLPVKYHYRCKDCGHVYPRKRAMDTKRYVCGVCQGSLKKS